MIRSLLFPATRSSCLRRHGAEGRADGRRMMMYKRPKLAIDDKKATRWAIAALKSSGLGFGVTGGALGIYDLVNMETGRAHRMLLTNGSMGRICAVAGSLLAGDYIHFNTSYPANFPDFDGAEARLAAASLVLYSWSWLAVLDGMSVLAKMKADGGSGLPSTGTVGGTMVVLYGDGMPIDAAQLAPDLEPDSSEHKDRRAAIPRRNPGGNAGVNMNGGIASAGM